MSDAVRDRFILVLGRLKITDTGLFRSGLFIISLQRGLRLVAPVTPFLSDQGQLARATARRNLRTHGPNRILRNGESTLPGRERPRLYLYLPTATATPFNGLPDL